MASTSVPGSGPASLGGAAAPSDTLSAPAQADALAAEGGSATPDTAGVMKAALGSIVDKPSLYLVRAAQATTLRQLKAARKQLRDFNTAARVQLEAQGAALEAGAAVLAGMRADLDAVNAALTARKQELLAQHPHLRDRLLARTPDVD